MLRELACFAKDLTIAQVRDLGKAAVSQGFDRICTTPIHIGEFRDNIPSLPVGALIDFPWGASTNKTRAFAMREAVKLGADYLDIVLDHSLALDRDFDSMELATRELVQVANKLERELRVILEYRLFQTDHLIQCVNSLKNVGVDTVVTGTSTQQDDISDNLTISYMLQEKTGIRVITASSIVGKPSLDKAVSYKIHGVRTSTVYTQERRKQTS